MLIRALSWTSGGTGATMPFTIRMLTNGVPQGEIRVQAVEFNVAMDDAIFRMPKG